MRLLVLFLFLTTNVFAQQSKILERLVVLDNNNKIWYNIDGYSVTSEVFDYEFNEKGLRKVYRKHKIRKGDYKYKYDSILANNFVVFKQEKLKNLVQVNSYYFVENQDGKIMVIWFAKTSEPDKEMQIELVNLIIQNQIPESNFVSMQTNTINFGNREIELGDNCYWAFLNTVQCPYFGEMNWSVHKDLDDAKNSIENQLNITKSRKMGKVVSEEMVDVEFEGVPTQARKIVFEIKGVTRLLTSLSGSKALIVYYIAEKVRGNYMSCVMSFWNNDEINPETNLPPLLEKVMSLK